ncbi:THO complex subunit 2-like isoform X3 [Mytilus californianus]|uniref:THO complex subunit 2-like isoform X3 n=1 Tax=Mytilus californianus TaxID=6549 RepID=UPI002247BEE3|nr:THO complex subunit 2-like isoform X3 [Mytilus californianus]
MAAMVLADVNSKSWDKSVKHDFLKQCKSFVNDNKLWTPGPKSLKQAFYDLCSVVSKGHVKQEQAVSVITDLCDYKKEVPLLLVDVFSIFDIETTCSEDKQERDRFISLVSAVEGLIAPTVFKERLDFDTLENVGLISSRQQYQAKYVKTKTRLFYKQMKFNLLREENEGYAKLVVELNQEITEKITPLQVIENLKSLIGCFDLDPNRVLDILLESFENRPEHDQFYIPMFREYVSEPKTLCNIMGFKFKFYASEETPQSLYKMAAVLLENGLVDLDLLYPHLSPADSKIWEFHEKDVNNAKAHARKLNIVSLADKTEDKKTDEEAIIDVHSTNQKLGLCGELLQFGCWSSVKQILDRLPEFFATSYRPVTMKLCETVHKMMESFYRENCGIPKKILKGKIKQDKKVPQVNSYRELHLQVFSILRYLGPYTAYDPVLIAKIIRLGKTFMSKRQDGGITPEDDIAYYGFLNMLDEVLLPSMSVLANNCCLSEELWSFLKLYPYELRYRLYGNWKNDTYSQHSKLICIRADCLEKAKYIMKRLSKENVKPSGRQLGKLSHSNPGVLFEYVLSQIQRYDNFIGPVVDSLKYLTSLSYDVLAYCIIEAVANPDRDRMKHDDTNISLWLQSLANFAGSICRKYTVELAGLMQYVANQLKAGKSFDLLILREIVQKMAGVEMSEEITNDQLEAMSGGELLRQEGGYFTQVRNTKKSSTRLKDTLLEHDLALSLCLLMAQQRDGVIFHESAAGHLKLVGKLYDQCQDTLVQFGSFLSMQLSTEEFVKRLPSVDTLIMSYNVPADAAFFLCRTQYAYAINLKYDELRKIDKANKQTSSQQKTQRYIEASEGVMEPVINSIRPVYNAKVWDDLSPYFFVTFWSLSVYDLAVPTSVYEKQKNSLDSQINTIEDNKDLPQSKKKKEKERCTTLLEKLKDEEKKQSEHVQRVHSRLKAQKEQWFISRSTKNETITQFLQLCIFPRCCFTASDAVYCAKFIHILHDLKTPNFSTLICYDRIFCDITFTVTSCTENEAHRYGRFLCAALDTIMRWHSERKIYEKECASYPGFVTVFRKGADSVNKADQLDFENYRHVCHKWHFRITKAMVACLESGNYIQIRNALIVLTKILPNYPKITQFGQALERRVDRLRQDEKEKRPDIYALAMGYSGLLKGKKTTWVAENEFHQKDNKAQAKVQAAKGGMATPTRKAGDEAKSGKQNEVKLKDNKDSKDPKEKKVNEKKEVKTDVKVKTEKKNDDKKELVNGTSKEKDSSKEKVEKKEKLKEEKKEKNKEEKKEKNRDKEEKKNKEDKKDKSSKEDKRAKESKHKDVSDTVVKEERHDSPRETKAKEDHKDRREKERQEKHDKTLKRSYTPDHDHKEPEGREKEVHRVEKSSSHTHHSPEISKCHSDERDVKRRKLDSPTGSKERRRSQSRDTHKRTPSPVPEVDRHRERDKERKDRKRQDWEDDVNHEEVKKRKSLEPSSSRSSHSKINGDTEKHLKRRESDSKSEVHLVKKEPHEATDDSPPRSKSRSTQESKVVKVKKDRDSVEESPTRVKTKEKSKKSDKERSRDKSSSSSKKSKK